MRKEIKRTIEFYLENIDTEKYKEYKAKSYEEGRKNHQEYIDKEKPHWRDRTDYYENFHISDIVFGDVLSNDGVVKLLKKLYSLPKKKFKVKNYYKKPPLKNKYDYIHLQYMSSGTGIFAEIELLNDKYIKEISILWVQINNYYAFMEYRISFHKCLDEKMYSSFIHDNIRKISKKDFAVWYNIDETREFDKYLALEQIHDEYFSIICQHYITTFLYSEHGKNKLLINMTIATRKEEIDIDKLYLGDISVSFYNKEDNYVIVSDYYKTSYLMMAGNNRIPYFGVCAYIARYGNDFYYRFFGTKELKDFEQNFSKYTTGRKLIKYNKEFMSLLNKMQSISENKLYHNTDFFDEFNKTWDFYVGNDKTDLKSHWDIDIEKYQTIYKNNFEYLKLLSEVHYSKINNLNSVIATITAIIATIISIIALKS